MAKRSLVCIQCPLSCSLEAKQQEGELVVTGNKCPRGIDYARAELTNPSRILTTTVKTSFPDFPRLAVKTSGEVPLEAIFAIMQVVNSVVVDKRLRPGDTVLEHLPGTDAVLVATDDMTVRGNFNGQQAASFN